MTSVRPLARRARARLKQMVGAAALEVARRNWRASYIGGKPYLLGLDYPPSAIEGPRYGHGQPPHGPLREVIAGHAPAFRRGLATIADYRTDLRRIPRRSSDTTEAVWDNNGWLPALDGAAIYAYLRSRSPTHYVEVGSGTSTKFAARAIRDGDLPTRMTSIDPAPRAAIDTLCDQLVRTPLEVADLSLFESLQPGDVIFFDGSHRVFANSDATVFFLDVVPVLARGVLVGVHDIFLPGDYPPLFADRYYSEQYLLAAYLLAEAPFLRPELAASYVCEEPEYRADLAPLWDGGHFEGADTQGAAFWFTVDRPAPA